MSTAIKPTPKFCYIDAMGGSPVQDDGSGPEVYVRGASSVALMEAFYVATNDGFTFDGAPQSAKFTSDIAGVHVTIIAEANGVKLRVDASQHDNGAVSIGVSRDVNVAPIMFPLDGGAIKFK